MHMYRARLGEEVLSWFAQYMAQDEAKIWAEIFYIVDGFVQKKALAENNCYPT